MSVVTFCTAVVSLLNIKRMFSNGNEELSDWNEVFGHSLCSWKGVTCDNETFEIISLNLSQLTLRGEISPSIGSLRFLRHIDFSQNAISGKIPAEIGDCLSLLFLDLSSNELSGEIPVSLSELKQLETLNLAYNKLTGRFPSLIYWSEALQILMLRGNFLTGNLSPLCHLTHLWYFNVRGNDLTGSIPGDIGNCSSFGILDLSHNRLRGEIPLSVSFLQLSTLSLESNDLCGRIPDGMGLMEALLIIDLSDNYLEGEIPVSLTNLTFLNKLYLHGNKFSGRIPGDLGNMSKLQYLLLQENELTGAIPGELGNLKLFSLKLSENFLTGSIPPNLGYSAALNILDLHGNNLNGRIPVAFSELGNLTFMNLSGNFLGGTIPDVLGKIVNLDTLDLSNNLLSGCIPESVGRLQHLLTIDFHNNQLRGSIPSNFGNLASLIVLDLSCNQLSGSVSPQLGRLQQLSFLNLSFNNLSGQIPSAENFLRFSVDSFAGNPKLCGNFLRSLLCPVSIQAPGTVRAWWVWGITIACLCMLAIMILGVIIFCWSRHTIKPLCNPQGVSRLVSFHVGMTCSYEEVMEITESLTNASLVGRGSSSTVYKFTLKNGQSIAVKKLAVLNSTDTLQFENELEVLAKVRHRNLVTLRGYALCPIANYLFYDYMEFGSLYDILHGSSRKVTLDWNKRLKISLGVAHGLAYLHHDCNPRIVHRDVKSCNILVDANFEAHLSDFGIAKNMQATKTHVSTTVLGTIGYIDPEYAKTSRLNEKSDVYSYGIVLLELLTGKKAVDEQGNLHDQVMSNVSCNTVMEFLDPCVKSTCESYISLEKVLKLGLLCTKKLPLLRPTMYDVSELLSLISR